MRLRITGIALFVTLLFLGLSSIVKVKSSGIQDADTTVTTSSPIAYSTLEAESFEDTAKITEKVEENEGEASSTDASSVDAEESGEEENELLTAYYSRYPSVEEECLNAHSLYRFCLQFITEMSHLFPATAAGVDQCFARVDEMQPVDIPAARLTTLYFAMGRTATFSIPVWPVVKNILQNTLWTPTHTAGILYFSAMKASYFERVWRLLCERNVPFELYPVYCRHSLFLHSDIPTRESWEPFNTFSRSYVNWSREKQKFERLNSILRSKIPLTPAQFFQALHHGANIHAMNQDTNVSFTTPQDLTNRDQFVDTLISYGLDTGFHFGITFILRSSIIQGDNIPWIKTLLMHGLDPNRANVNEHLLLLALVRNKVQTAHLLLTCGADPNVRSKSRIFSDVGLHKVTALMITDSRGMIRRLLEKGADLNAQTVDGRSVLFYVIKRGIAQILVAAGANVQHRALNQQTLLMAWINNERLIQFALERGVPVNAVDLKGNNALHFAFAEKSTLNVIRRLIEAGGNLNHFNAWGKTPLMLSGMDVDLHWWTLVRGGIQPNLQDLCGHTALHVAVARGFHNLTRLLLRVGSSPNLMNKEGNSAFAMALVTRDLALVQMILESGGAVENLNEYEAFTALITTLDHESKVKIMALLDEGKGSTRKIGVK